MNLCRAAMSATVVSDGKSPKFTSSNEYVSSTAGASAARSRLRDTARDETVTSLDTADMMRSMWRHHAIVKKWGAACHVIRMSRRTTVALVSVTVDNDDQVEYIMTDAQY